MKRQIAMTVMAFLFAAGVLVFAVYGPEYLARYKDKGRLGKVTVQQVENLGAGYRYTLTSNEKLFILSRCLKNQVRPESEQSVMAHLAASGTDGGDLAGTYAFVENHQGPSGRELTEEQIFDVVNGEVRLLTELGVLPEGVREITKSAYKAVLYSAIDVLEPRNNVAVWKISLSTDVANIDRENRLIDAYVDGDTGKICEFYVRTRGEWSDFPSDEMVKNWASYLELTGVEQSGSVNPLSETTSYFEKYTLPGMENQTTVVTVGFYDGIDELFLKVE